MVLFDAAALADRQLGALGERYTVGALLGTGRFSQVSMGLARSGAAEAPRGKCALKVIPLETLDDDDEAFEMLEAEVAALRRAAASPHLMRVTPTLHEVLHTAEDLVLVMDCVAGCELFELIDAQGALPPAAVCSLMAQLLTALAALHALDIVHRDIKPENLMVSAVGADGTADGSRDLTAAPLAPDTALHLTVIDFGYAALEVSQRGEPSLRGLSGSPEYAAPEVLSWLAGEVPGRESEATAYSSKCDVWSTGVTAHVLLCAELPFEPDEGEGEEEMDEMQFVELARAADVRLQVESSRPEGPIRSPARPASARSSPGRPPASASRGQLAALFWLAAHTGLVFHTGPLRAARMAGRAPRCRACLRARVHAA